MSGMDNLWTEDRLVPNAQNAIGLSFAPAASVFNNKIYLFHHGKNNDGKIWFSTFDGANWSQDTPLAGGSYYGIKNSPAVAVFKDKLYVVYHDPSDKLRIGTMDSSGTWRNVETAPKYDISYSPAVAVFQNRLYIAYQGSDDNAGCLMYTSTDGDTFAPEQRIQTAGGDIHVTGSPALTIYQNKLHCFHKGSNETIDLSLILLLDNICDFIPIDNPWVLLPFQATLAVVEEMTPLGDIKLAVQAGILLKEVITKHTARTGDWTWHTAFDGNSWAQDVFCPSAAAAYGVNSEAPAAIEYKGGLFCIRQGRDSSYLWFGLYDGQNWCQDQTIGRPGSPFCTTGAPALVVFNDTLYCFHQEKDDKGWLWMTSITAPKPSPAGTGNILISCDNEYTLYVNGQLVGSGTNWQSLGKYPVTFNAGENVVAVQGVDRGGMAAMIAEVQAGARMYTTGAWISPDHSWRVSTQEEPGWQSPNFDDSRWAAATDYGAYGSGPWAKNILGLPEDTQARWIWSDKNDADDVVYMRLKFNTTPNVMIGYGGMLRPGNTPHTVSARVKVTAMPTRRAWMMLLGNEGTGSHHWLLNPDGSAQFGAWGGEQLKPTLPVNKWVHICMTFDGTTLKYYLDGVLSQECPATFNLQGIPLDCGKAHNGEANFDGFVNNLRVTLGGNFQW